MGFQACVQAQLTKISELETSVQLILPYSRFRLPKLNAPTACWYDFTMQSNPEIIGLLRALALGDLDTVLILCDALEERGDPRAARVRGVYGELYDLWMFAPRAFGHFNPIRRLILPWFPEFQEALDDAR